MTDTADVLEFYRAPGPLTDLGATPEFALRSLPDDPDELCALAGRLVVHEQLAARLGWRPPPERRAELQVRGAGELVGRLLAHDASDLTGWRPRPRRLLGNCRQVAVLACALLRHRNIPARARCGFATYFEVGKAVDHWVVEVASTSGWRRIDPELCDPETRAATGAEVVPFDLPDGAFQTGGEAWSRCRAGRADPSTFGIVDMWGLWFVRGNLVRDLAALNKVELLPWDGWGLLHEPFEDTDADALSCLDDLAAVTSAGALEQVQERCTEPGLRVPGTVTAWGEMNGQEVEVPELTRLRGTVIEESLTSSAFLDAVQVAGSTIFAPDDRAPYQPATWTVTFFEAPGSQADRVAALLAENLGPGWWADFHNHDRAWIVFAGRPFERRRGDHEAARAAADYGRSVGVPESQLDWTP